MLSASVDDGGISDVGGGIDANRTRCHLRDGNDIRELTHRHPMVVRDDLTLNHRDHGIATAEAEEAYEEEGVEELKEDHSNV
jgi:hypothetical protein